MAKAPKTLSAADKKIAVANLKTLLKANAEAVKAINATRKDADKVMSGVSKDHAVARNLANASLTVAKKEADALYKAAAKVYNGMHKDADAIHTAATKAHAAVVAKTEKQLAAAQVGADKLAAQLAALEVVAPADFIAPVTASTKPAKKVKAKAAEPELEAA